MDKQSGIASHSVGAVEEILGTAILGDRQNGHDKIHPAAEFIINMGDELLVSSVNPRENSITEEPKRKTIVLADDNPVIADSTHVYLKRLVTIWSRQKMAGQV